MTANPSAIAAFVLAGGRSSRMGADKATLVFHGQTLLAHALALARNVTGDVRIVGDPAKFGALGPTVGDIYPGCGPLGGIHAALSQTTNELNLTIAVDMPLLEAGFLKYLVERAQQSSAVVTVPRTRDGWQPLCAVYRRDFVDYAERALREGNYRIDRIFPKVSTSVIDDEELGSHGFDAAMFSNVNTPEEWARLNPNA